MSGLNLIEELDASLRVQFECEEAACIIGIGAR